jgi:hypothetical protein
MNLGKIIDLSVLFYELLMSYRDVLGHVRRPLDFVRTAWALLIRDIVNENEFTFVKI